MTDEHTPSNVGKSFDIFDTSRDHRTLFTVAEVEAAYSRVMPADEARAAAELTCEGPIAPHRPAFFTDDVLRLLSELSDDMAQRVRAAQGY